MRPERQRLIRSLFQECVKMYAKRDGRLTAYFSENFSGHTGGCVCIGGHQEGYARRPYSRPRPAPYIDQLPIHGKGGMRQIWGCDPSKTMLNASQFKWRYNGRANLVKAATDSVPDGDHKAMVYPSATARRKQAFMLFAFPNGPQGNVANAGTNELIIPNSKQTWGNIRKLAAAPEAIAHLCFKPQGHEAG